MFSYSIYLCCQVARIRPTSGGGGRSTNHHVTWLNEKSLALWEFQVLRAKIMPILYIISNLRPGKLTWQRKDNHLKMYHKLRIDDFSKVMLVFFGYIRQDDTLCLFVGIPLSLGHRFLAKSPRPRLGLLVPAVSLTYFAISKSPARRFGKGKLSSFDLWRSMKVDSSQFFDDFCSSWIFRRTKHFVASKFLGAPIWCNPQMWCPGHFVGTWLVWHLCGVPMAMILHLSWWYGQFFQQGWLGMTSRLKIPMEI